MKKVLIVDDTKNIRNLLTTCLELNGYTVFTGKNGVEAIELIEKESFDLAFLDIKMPELSGTEVLRRLRAMGLTFPVVVMTAYSTVKNAVECTKLGAVAYLQKPFKVDKVNDLLNMLEEVDSEKDSLQNLMKQAKDLIHCNKSNEALSLLKKGLSIDSSNGELYYLIGKLYEKDSNSVEANKYFSTAEVFNYKH
jgi:two-component system, OmpR family, response regulator